MSGIVVQDMGLLVDRGVGGQGVWISSIGELASPARAISNVAIASGRVSAATAAEVAYFVPFLPGANLTLRTGWWYNGASLAGNIDLGIYDKDLKRVASTGAVAQANANVIQSAAFTIPAVLKAGVPYYLAISSSSTGDWMGLDCGIAAAAKAVGIGQATSSHPLPAIVTNLATTGSQYLWIFGAADRNPI